jgi:hypothetical protein
MELKLHQLHTCTLSCHLAESWMSRCSHKFDSILGSRILDATATCPAVVCLAYRAQPLSNRDCLIISILPRCRVTWLHTTWIVHRNSHNSAITCKAVADRRSVPGQTPRARSPARRATGRWRCGRSSLSSSIDHLPWASALRLVHTRSVRVASSLLSVAHFSR